MDKIFWSQKVTSLGPIISDFSVSPNETLPIYQLRMANLGTEDTLKLLLERNCPGLRVIDGQAPGATSVRLQASIHITGLNFISQSNVTGQTAREYANK